MTKINLQRGLETSRLLKTESGRELQELLEYVATFAEQTLRALRNGVSVQDNIDAQYITVTMQSGVDQIIASTKSPVGLYPIRVVEPDTRIAEHGWFFNDQGEIVANIVFAGAVTESQVVYLALYS